MLCGVISLFGSLLFIYYSMNKIICIVVLFFFYFSLQYKEKMGFDICIPETILTTFL